MRFVAVAVAAVLAVVPGGAPASEGRAGELAAWAGRCELGFAVDCRKLGRAHLLGEGAPADDRLAAALLMKGCEIGEPASCSDLGVLTLIGRGVAQDDAVGAALTRRACDAANALACSNLGTLTAEGIHRLTLGPGEEAQGATRVVRAFQIACDAGAPEGCLNFGTALARGALVTRDAPAAARALRRACDGGLPLACHRLALLAAESPGNAAAGEVAAARLKACRAGIAPACAGSGEGPGPAGPRTPTPALVAERSSFALGIPGAGGFHPIDMAMVPPGARRHREALRRLSASQLAGLTPGLRRRLEQELPAEVEATLDEPVELLIRLRRAQLAGCLERDRASRTATRLAAMFLVESNGKPGELRTGAEPADPELEACALEVLGGWSLPVPAGGVSGPYLVQFDFEAPPPGPPPRYASASVLRAALKEPGCLERNLRLPAAFAGADQAVVVKLAVDTTGQPRLLHALTPTPQPVAAAIAEAARACAFTPGTGPDGQPVSLWLTLTVKLNRR